MDDVNKKLKIRKMLKEVVLKTFRSNKLKQANAK